MEERSGRLAPNGEPSALPDPLYGYVRTPEFRSRYGDWEHGSGRVPLDSNGEPLVLWHGSANSFESFDFSRAGENTGLVEYTDLRTGEKVGSDSGRAMFFTDNRELAVSYAFLAKTQEYGDIHSSLSDCISLLRLSGFANSRIKTVDDFRDFVRRVRGGDDSELIAAFSGIDIDVDHPLSRLDESVREDVRERLIAARSRYSRLYDANRSGGLSNQLNNYVRQSEYFRYFVENFDRLCSNDFTVRSEFWDDLTSHSVSFFSPEGNFGLSFHAEDARIALYGYKEGKVYVDTLTAQERLDVLGRIRDDLNSGIRNLNETLRSSGYADAVHLYPVFLQVGNPLVHDYQGSSFPDKYKPNEKYDTAYIAARQVRRALEQGNDAVVYQNIRDPFDGTSYGVFSDSQIEMLRGRDLGLDVLPYLNELPLNCIYMEQNENIQAPEGMRELTKDEMAQTAGGVVMPERASTEGIMTPAPMYYLDREWFDVKTGQLMGDMQWSLEEADNYRSVSPGRLRDIAVNLSLADMQFQDAEGLIPVYHVCNEEESGAVHVVVACHDIPEELKALLSFVEEAEIEAVAAEQEAIEIKEDAESREREEEQQRRQEAVNHMAEACLGLAVMAELHFSPLEIMGRSFDSMTWHEGRDGEVYYNLSSSETMERTPGMALFRLQDFMGRAPLSSLERAVSEVLGTAPREDVSYVETEGESIARGASDIEKQDGLSFEGVIDDGIPFGINRDHLFYVEGGVDYEFILGEKDLAKLEAADREGLLHEAVMSAVGELREDPELSAGVALDRGLREWDVDIPLSIGRGR